MDQDNEPNNRNKEQAPKRTATENQQPTAAKPKEKNEQQLQQHTDSKGLMRSVTVNLTTL